MKQHFHSNGKLLLSGEYVVLDGATALAIPTKYGQSLIVETTDAEGIQWQSFNEKGQLWFEDFFNVKDLTFNKPDNTISKTLAEILKTARILNPEFLSEAKGFSIKNQLDFPRNWGLGTSSTLINNIAQWAKVDAFKLLQESFGGSGYDIAAAQNDSPILFQLKNEQPIIKKVSFDWDFTDQLFFVHLNQKQDSKEGIARYKKAKVNIDQLEGISRISRELLNVNSLSAFEKLLQQHERIVSEIIKLPSIKDQLFNDYTGTIKSLGAWGGDFVLATSTSAEMNYFKKKGFETIIPFEEMIK